MHISTRIPSFRIHVVYLCSLEMIKLLMSYSALWTSWIRSLRLSLSTTLIHVVYACYTSVTVTQTSALCMTYNRMWEIMMDQAQIRTTALWIFCSQVRYQLSYLAQVIKPFLRSQMILTLEDHTSTVWVLSLDRSHPVSSRGWSLRHQM